jgi:hypothetical protein
MALADWLTAYHRAVSYKITIAGWWPLYRAGRGRTTSITMPLADRATPAPHYAHILSRFNKYFYRFRHNID